MKLLVVSAGGGFWTSGICKRRKGRADAFAEKPRLNPASQ